jgi:peptide/nickel transport system permease protein
MARRRIAIGLGFLGAVHAIVFLAAWIAPYDYAEQHRDFPYAPPSRIHFDGLRPVVDGHPVRFFVGGRLFGVERPGVIFLLGSDASGRDLLSRLLYGAQISLLTGILASFLALAVGTALGTIAGFYGGWLDQALMRGGELVLALPWLYLLLAVRAFLPLHIGTWQAFFLLIAIIGGVGWVRPARLVRGVVMTTRERPYVLAARGFGASGPYLIRRHILPSTAGVFLTQATVLIPQYILAEVTLSFLGLGVGEPVPSWGNMLSEARQYHALVAHPWMLAPAFAAIPILFAYMIVADQFLEDSLNYRLRHIGR